MIRKGVRVKAKGKPSRKKKASAGDSLPLYQKVKVFVLDGINSGTWPTDSRIPSEAELMKACEVSRMTANRALRELTHGGYLMRRQGVGTFVAARKPRSALLEIKSISEEILERGGTYTSRVLLHCSETASPDLAIAMNLRAQALVFHTVIIHLENDTPVQYEDRYVNPSVAPDYIQQDFSSMTPSQYLLDVAPLTEAEHIIEAVIPDKKCAKLLRMQSKEPCLLVHRRTWTYNVVATKSRLMYPGCRYQIGGRFKPSDGLGLAVA